MQTDESGTVETTMTEATEEETVSPTTEPGTGTVYTEATSMTAGESYIIAVGSGSSVNAVTVPASGYAVDATAFTVSNSTITTDVVWTYNSSGYLTNGSLYLYLGKVNSSGSTSSSGTTGAYAISSSRAVSYSSSAQTLSASGNSSTTYYLTYADGAFSAASSSSSASSVRIFVQTGESGTVETTVTEPTESETVAPITGSGDTFFIATDRHESTASAVC